MYVKSEYESDWRDEDVSRFRIQNVVVFVLFSSPFPSRRVSDHPNREIDEFFKLAFLVFSPGCLFIFYFL